MLGSNFGPDCRDLRYMDSNVNKTKFLCKIKNHIVDDTYENAFLITGEIIRYKGMNIVIQYRCHFFCIDDISSTQANLT